MNLTHRPAVLIDILRPLSVMAVICCRY